MVDQVAQWLASSPEQKRQYMEAHTKVKELTDMSHPAYRRFKELNEPWGLRKKEYALHFRRVGPRSPLLISSAIRPGSSRPSGLHKLWYFPIVYGRTAGVPAVFTSMSRYWSSLSTSSAGRHRQHATQRTMRSNIGTLSALRPAGAGSPGMDAAGGVLRRVGQAGALHRSRGG